MIFEKAYQPHFPLNQYVDWIWVAKAPALQLKAKHHAALFTELIFNYGDNLKVTGQNIQHIFNQNDHQILSGLKTEPFQTEIAGTYASIGFILKPFCYGMIVDKLGTQAMEKTSAVLYELLYDRENPDFVRAEQEIIRLFHSTHLDPTLIQFEHYLSSVFLERGALNHFNTFITISQKSFIQKFKKTYLLTPHEYIILRKINTAIQLIQHQESKKLVEIGLEAGFYDQAHFVKLFKKFCGITPKEFSKSSFR